MEKYFKKILIVLLFFILSPLSASADMTANFFVDQSYSVSGDNKISATLVNDINGAYFYIDNSFWNTKNQQEKNIIIDKLNALSNNFRYEIYPGLTNAYGPEWIPGIDRDKKLTILFHPMKKDAMGYVRNIDEYEKTVNPFSNEKEMVYLNTDSISGSLLKEALSHEFMHLITFNQKEKLLGITEEIWLNEARSEYAPTLLGYDNEDKETYLDKRIGNFINNSSDSLTEWRGSSNDYGIVSLFTHYLVEQYGLSILVDSLRSPKKGIASINEALQKNEYKEDFSQIFSNFSIAIYINDCSVSTKYCFKNDKLKNIRVLPYSNFLPFSGESKLSINQSIKNWSSQWQKFSGGGDSVDIEITAPVGKGINIAYVIRKLSGDYVVQKLSFDSSSYKKISIQNMNSDVSSVVIIPSLEDMMTDETTNNSSAYNIASTTFFTNSNPNQGSITDVKLPFQIDKPLSLMNKEELLMVLLRLVIYLFSQGKLVF